tara:strand:+ start:89 stop:457 length:369 start_codon:yes stop_codon:yes gene_type:complete
MKIKWERNSKVLSLLAQRKIHPDDIIHRTTTDKFPADAATVRMTRVTEKTPHVTIHIRGKSKQRTTSWNNQTYECASTCRVNFSNIWSGQDFGMSSNGELDSDLTWLDVHNAVEEVKETLDI